MGQAVLAFVQWEGQEGTEPEGWMRHVQSGRRRPGGDPTQEYINP
jgi:hypothetical protein